MQIYNQASWALYARELWEKGMTIFPVNEAVVEQARFGFKAFLQRRDERGDHARWRLQRPGESESDLGLLQRTGGEHDVKSFFHHDSSLERQLQRQQLSLDAQDSAFLASNRQLLQTVNHFGRRLTGALDTLYGIDCQENYVRCQSECLPYCATTLRSLYYPDGPAQTGAKAHVDRGFLTIHLGDEGGKLQALDTAAQWMDISPPAGYAVAFFGVKVLSMTGGRQQPLRHRSVTFPGHDRFAFVHFGHVSLPDYVVQDANTALAHWREQQLI